MKTKTASPKSLKYQTCPKCEKEFELILDESLLITGDLWLSDTVELVEFHCPNCKHLEVVYNAENEA